MRTSLRAGEREPRPQLVVAKVGSGLGGPRNDVGWHHPSACMSSRGGGTILGVPMFARRSKYRVIVAGEKGLIGNYRVRAFLGPSELHSLLKHGAPTPWDFLMPRSLCTQEYDIVQSNQHN